VKKNRLAKIVAALSKWPAWTETTVELDHSSWPCPNEAETIPVAFEKRRKLGIPSAPGGAAKILHRWTKWHK